MRSFLLLKNGLLCVGSYFDSVTASIEFIILIQKLDGHISIDYLTHVTLYLFKKKP